MEKLFQETFCSDSFYKQSLIVWPGLCMHSCFNLMYLKYVFYITFLVYCIRCHEFKWHGEDPNQKGRMIPGHNKFTLLATVPDQFYYNVSKWANSKLIKIAKQDMIILMKIILIGQLWYFRCEKFEPLMIHS